ncbi:SslE/AcfD family lipoprotein zinc metalloprotease [Vibrio rhodolitus]|uniref:SslE/AcfD family lipoprotein zinc metalloprotease n=1 Tax=Vibrio rhodolitus TaxID=2231649 RepID=UPI000E0A1344|nr:SslE/AcfD family lipoprotein zinc metalloprotease [Vibrio rhodolitus]
MNRSILAVLIGAVLMNGCNDDSLTLSVSDTDGPGTELPDTGGPTNPDIPEPPLPPEPPEPAPIEYEFYLTQATRGTAIIGASCDGQVSGERGKLALVYTSDDIPERIYCDFGGAELASFDKGEHYLNARTRYDTTIYLDLDNSSLISETNIDALNNVKSLLVALDNDGETASGVDLTRGEDYAETMMVQDLYQLHRGAALSVSEEEFKTNNIDILKDQGEADKQPGHGTDIEPEFTEGSTNIGGSGMVSANAESIYQYVPEKKINESSNLVFSGEPVQGISYYGPSFRGVTDGNGTFNYNWGETVTFSVGALTLGSVTAKGVDIELNQLSSDKVIAANIETFVEQFDTSNTTPWHIEEKVHQRFAQESNNIVEKINLSLANGDKPKNDSGLDWGAFPTVSNEFRAQFQEGGSAADILADLNLAPLPEKFSFDFSSFVMRSELTPAQELKVMMGQNSADHPRPVRQFHVFANQHDGYQMPGPMAATFINISNFGTPVVMPRNDINSAIPLGGLAIKDKFGRSFPQLAPLFIGDLANELAPTYIDKANTTYWNPKPDQRDDTWYENSYAVNKETTTFGLPFVMTGKIGQGRLLVLGNTLYNSILVSPYHYSDVNHELVNASGVSDGPDMHNFMVNSFTWLAGKESISIATNRDKAYFAQKAGTREVPFALANEYQNWTLGQQEPSTLTLGNPDVYILQAYPLSGNNPDRPLYEEPLISDEDVDHLIDYVKAGGHVVIMETLGNKTLPVLGRLLDTAGISAIGRTNEVGHLIKLPETFRVNPNPVDGYQQNAPNSSRPVYDEDVYLLESIIFSSEGGEKPSADNPPEKGYFWDEVNNTYYWGKKSHESKTVLRGLFRPNSVRSNKTFRDEAAKNCERADNLNTCIDAYLADKVVTELAAWKADLKQWYGVAECTNDAYDYELDCIETRRGNGIPMSITRYPGANDMAALFKRLQMSSEVSNGMIAAADMGSNLDDLYKHELYYRSGGSKGVRLSSIDVERIYGNLSAWMWNDFQYRFDGGKDDFGHKRVVEYLNCYSNDNYGNPVTSNMDQGTIVGEIFCPVNIKAEMIQYGFLVSPNSSHEYVLNPSYPLNYLEKPFTRMMLGRSYFDAKHKQRSIGVDVREYPGVATFGPAAPAMTIHKGSRQSTGVWVGARETASVMGLGANDTVMVAMVDNLTGRVKHEMALKRPPRVSVTFNGLEAAKGFEVPYGGLIYITVSSAESVDVTFSGAVQLAPLFKMTSATKGEWVTSPDQSDAPLSEIVANRFVYTTTTAGVKGHSTDDILTMAKQLDLFTISANEFYGRDEVGEGATHGMFTDSEMPYVNMRMVDDAQISIGAAHSGYPVMVDRFPRSQAGLINASTNWLVGHEIGHNLAANWFNVEGAGETANNLLALYNQDRNLGEMSRIKTTITQASTYAQRNEHPWANGSNADRLNFFAQLKIWAEKNFRIEDWESAERLAQPRSIYNKTASGEYDQGWNFMKLVHRMAREGRIVNGQTNYCSSAIKAEKGLTQEGMLMVCSSYLSGVDLQAFFHKWNIGETKQTINFEDKYFGGVAADGKASALMQELRDARLIQHSSGSPLNINSAPEKGDVLQPQIPYWVPKSVGL